MFLYLNKSLIVNGDYLANCERLNDSVVECLDRMNVRSELHANKICFKNIRKNSTDSGENKSDAMKLLREGEIYFSENSSNEIKISWKINLEYLIFMSVMFGVVVGFISWFYFGYSLALGLLLLISLSALVYIIGCFLINEKMNYLVERVLKDNHLLN